MIRCYIEHRSPDTRAKSLLSLRPALPEAPRLGRSGPCLPYGQRNNTIDSIVVVGFYYRSLKTLGKTTVTADPIDLPPTEGPDAQVRKFQRELAAGLTSLVLLSVLSEAEGDLYGYEIARRLSVDRARASPFKQGALYPVLRNMSAAGLLSSRVVPSYSGPPRRYYRITPLGREVLGSWRATWQETRDFVDSIVQSSAAPETTQ